MASITRRQKSKYWTACYTDRDGRQLKRTTKTTDRNLAMQMAVEFENAERQARQGVLVTAQIRKVVNDLTEKVNGDSLHVPTTTDYLNKWLTGIVARNSPATAIRYKGTVKQFLESLQGKAQKPISSVTSQDVENFLNSRLKANRAPKTAIVDLKIIKGAFGHAERYGVILKNPVAAVRLPKENSSEREVFTISEIALLLKASPSLEWQTLILLGYYLGARLSDCVKMKWDNVFPELGVIRYEPQKTSKPVTIPMHFNIYEHLNHLATFGSTGFLCPKLAVKAAGGKRGLSQSFNRIVLRANLDPMTIQGKGIRKFSRRTFHSLRHSFNSVMANAGVQDEIRMKLTGHKSKAQNERYTHLQLETLKSAVQTMPILGGVTPAS